MSTFIRAAMKWAGVTAVLAAPMGMYVAGFRQGLDEGIRDGYEFCRSHPGSEHSHGFSEGYKACLDDIASSKATSLPVAPAHASPSDDPR